MNGQKLKIVFSIVLVAVIAVTVISVQSLEAQRERQWEEEAE